MQTQRYLNQLITILSLSEYQASVLKSNYKKYDMTRLEKHGHILYAPHRTHGLYNKFSHFFYGHRADFIAQNETVLCNTRADFCKQRITI